MDIDKIKDMIDHDLTNGLSENERENALIAIVHLMGEAFLNMLEDSTNDANVHELLEWCYPDIDKLPGSDEDEDQTEYISRLEAFEDMLCIAAKPTIAMMYADKDKK